MNKGLTAPYKLTADGGRYEISANQRRVPPLRMRLFDTKTAFTILPSNIHQVLYRSEQSRGYPYEGNLWSPGFFHIDMRKTVCATLVASTEKWEIIEVLVARGGTGSRTPTPRSLARRCGSSGSGRVAAELVFAADQFIITPAGRAQEAARAHASGDEVRTVVAGYHWFTDWGRDTMISLEGLALVTGRCMEAGYILRTFAHYVRDGFIPNMFPDGKTEGLYHTADATLWFFHALDRYLKRADDRTTLKLLLPTLIDIVEHHLHGTKYNIHVDLSDGLLYTGPGRLSAHVDGCEDGRLGATPRRGKAVEINALWYNALKILVSWLRGVGKNDAAARYDQHAEQARASFNERFWLEEGGYLYDVVDCNGEKGTADRSCRPNQIFAISLIIPFWMRNTGHR